jgi:sRNA-binding protein
MAEIESNNIKLDLKKKKTAITNTESLSQINELKITSSTHNSKNPLFETLNWLRTTFPSTFVAPHKKIKPLKVGIIKDLFSYLAINPSPITKTRCRQAIKHYVKSKEYQAALLKIDTPRVDLQGISHGTVTIKEASFAEYRNKKHKKNIINTA